MGRVVASVIGLAGLGSLVGGCLVAFTDPPRRDAEVQSCGNGELDPSECCDDGNLSPGDGCSPGCSCETCDASSCPTGCCDAMGSCQAGRQDLSCGTGGTPCSNCLGLELVCDQSMCVSLGPCEPDTERECGNCGTRTCDAEGRWGACASEGECVEDAVTYGGPCPACGLWERSCSSDCVWLDSWTCVNQGECPQEGATELGGSCGVACGVMQRTCLEGCRWGEWECEETGDCTPSATETVDCPCGGGQSTRQCSDACEWGEWSACDPPCNGHGTCREDDTCSCAARFAGLRCERCNEPDDHFGYPTCNSDPPDGTCTCSLESDPDHSICNYHICRSTSDSCTGCGSASRRKKKCVSCLTDMTCSDCYCLCTCTTNEVLQRSCDGGLVQESVCQQNCDDQANCWSNWSSCQ